MSTLPAGDNRPTLSFRKITDLPPSPRSQGGRPAQPDGTAVLAAIHEALRQMRDAAPIVSLTVGDIGVLANKLAENDAFVTSLARTLSRLLGPIASAEEIADAVVDAYSRRWAFSAPPPVDR